MEAVVTVVPCQIIVKMIGISEELCAVKKLLTHSLTWRKCQLWVDLASVASRIDMLQ